MQLHRNWGFVVVFTLLIAIGANHIVEAAADWHLHDMEVYRDAARRIINAGPLYGGDVTALNSYRYAPWFAFAWIPLALLPDLVVNVSWSLLLLGASVLCIQPLLAWDRPRIALLILFAPILFGISAVGNVQPLLVALLIWGIPRRWGWLAVGIAGSLKIVPLAYCAVFVAQRRWWQAAGSVAVAAVLWIPIIWMQVDPITFESGIAQTLPTFAWLGVAVASAGVTIALAGRRSHYTSVAAGVAAVLALPRLFVYEIAVLMPAIPPPSDTPQGRRRVSN